MSAIGQTLTLEGRLGAVWRACYRYGLSSLGPVAVSAAHFVASLLFLRLSGPEEFGQFAFLLIVVPFCLGSSGALLGAPAFLTRGKDEATARTEIVTLQKTSLVAAPLAGIAVGALMVSSHAGLAATLLFGLYGALQTVRGFARSLANVRGRIEAVAASDVFYAAMLTAGLAALALSGGLSMRNAALVLALATAAAIVPFGADYLFELAAAAAAPLRAYLPMWQTVSRWSLLGVALTEVAANAHAYLVTFIAGPGAFGLLALGALFMRPTALVLGALPDIDQPVMARHIAQNDLKGAFRVVNEFRTAAGAVLVATIVLSVALVVWFPHLLLKHYGVPEAAVVLAFWIVITGLRVVRTPEAVFVQATGNYPALARISFCAGLATLAVALAMLLAFGPVASLAGVVAGEVVMVVMLFPLTGTWRRKLA